MGTERYVDLTCNILPQQARAIEVGNVVELDHAVICAVAIAGCARVYIDRPGLRAASNIHFDQLMTHTVSASEATLRSNLLTTLFGCLGHQVQPAPAPST